jgi:hypothetical protein
MDLPQRIAAMAQNPVRFTSAQATELREQLGAAGRKKKRTEANVALKFVRKVSTTRDGVAFWDLWDLSRLRGSTWALPAWHRPGKGQYGEFQWGNDTMELDLNGIAAQLDDDDFGRLFGDGGGLHGVAIASVGVTAVWWAQKAADFDLVLVGARGRLHLKPRFDGSMATSWFEHGEAIAGAGPSEEYRAGRWKKYHSEKKVDDFLVGGYDDPIVADYLRRRAEPGGPDAEVEKVIALARSQEQGPPDAPSTQPAAARFSGGAASSTEAGQPTALAGGTSATTPPSLSESAPAQTFY